MEKVKQILFTMIIFIGAEMTVGIMTIGFICKMFE